MIQALANTMVGQVGLNIVAALAGLLIGLGVQVARDRVLAWLSRRHARVSADEVLRKLEAKKLNEHIKLLGSFCNTVGAAIIGAAFIAPYIGQHTIPDPDKMVWIGVGLALPVAGQIGLRFMKSEG